MDSNTYSTQPPSRGSGGLAALAAVADELAAQDLDRLGDAVRAERVLALRRLVDRLEGQWLKELAGVDAHDAAGAEQDREVGSTGGLAAGSAASGCRRRRQFRPDRPSVVPRPPGGHG